MRFRSFLSLAGMLFAFAAAAFAQDGIIIEKKVVQKPTVLFRGCSGNSGLSNRIASDLNQCGWFRVVNSGASDYVVSGEASGSTLRLHLANGANVPIASFQVPIADEGDASHAAVDAVLNNRFDIPGICRSRIVFTAASGKTKEIYVCDYDGRNIQRVSYNGNLSLEPVWTPDNRSVVYSFVGNSFTHLIQQSMEDKNLKRRLTQYPGLNAGGAVSPDGRYVALVLATGNQVDLYVRPLEGGELKRLTNDVAAEASPCWSPDGKRICFVSDRSGRPLLYIVNPFTNEKPQLLRGITGSERVTPSWSNDDRIAYCGKVGGSYVLKIARLTGPYQAKEEPIGQDGKAIRGQTPSWAPDDRHLVVADGGALYVVDSVTGERRKIVSGGASQPDWSGIISK